MKGIQGTSNKTYRQIMGNGLRYEIPKFQRDYTWETEHWDDLWQDIGLLLLNEENEHYMGYLVLQTSNNKSYQIIDGQQRLTTLSIIILCVLKALDDLAANNSADSSDNIRRKENLQNSYIGYVDPVTLISNNKLKLNRNSDDYYRQYMVLLKDLPLRNTNSSEKNMRECFYWYYDRIKRDFKTGESLAAFIDNIVDRLFFTVIEVTDQLNAFKVFETLNARGIQLSAADLLKNYLFSVVDETKPHISEIEELENIWGNIAGKLGEEKLEDYLRYFWNSYNKSTSKKALFKTIKNNILNKAEVFKLTRDMADTADLYLAIQNPDDDFWNEAPPELREGLDELKLFQIRQTYSLLISGYKNLPLQSFIKLVKICAVISFRYNIIGGLNPNAQEDVYNSIALQINKEKRFDQKSFSSVYVPNHNFENDFSSKQFKNTARNHKIVKYIFTKLERYKYGNEINRDSDTITVEHILPEAADESWGDFTSEEINRAKYRIGNLTLLEKKLNQDAGMLSYSAKIQYFEKSNCQITKKIPENFHSWNEKKIIERQKDFAKDAKAIWVIHNLE